MKKVIVTQRLSKDKKTNEIRDALDIRLTRYLLSLKIFPILIANSFGEKSPIFIKRFVDEMKPHGLILTGGEDFGKNIPRDKVENLLLKYFTRKKKPILGICRGMQIMGTWAGAMITEVSDHVAVEHNHFSFEAYCHLCCIGTSHTAANDDDFGRLNTWYATEENAHAAICLSGYPGESFFREKSCWCTRVAFGGARRRPVAPKVAPGTSPARKSVAEGAKGCQM